MSHFDFEMDRLRRFGQCTPFGMWEFFVESGVDTTLPPMDQVDEFFTKAVLNFCNDSYAQMYGFESASNLEGKPLSFLFPMNEDNLKFLLDWIAFKTAFAVLLNIADGVLDLVIWHNT